MWHITKLLAAGRNGEIDVFTSIITVAECTHVEGGKPQPALDIQEFYSELLTSGRGGVTLVQATLGIVELSRQLRWKDGLHLTGLDSIHLATAIHMGCQEIITTDGKISKCAESLQARISIIQASATKLLPPKYNVRELEGLNE